ncbi:hypothetical protein B566_EDAN001397 [Ephemera danica]|nr:hypothetical protein B566_EDAN001397 [Ephemera danica]
MFPMWTLDASYPDPARNTLNSRLLRATARRAEARPHTRPAPWYTLNATITQGTRSVARYRTQNVSPPLLITLTSSTIKKGGKGYPSIEALVGRGSWVFGSLGARTLRDSAAGDASSSCVDTMKGHWRMKLCDLSYVPNRRPLFGRSGGNRGTWLGAAFEGLLLRQTMQRLTRVFRSAAFNVCGRGLSDIF